MTHRALLLGAAYGTLLHVPRSLERLEAALGRHGFRCVERHLDLAPEILLAELDRFVAKVEAGDAVAIAYVGHGGRRAGLGYLRPSPALRPVVGLELGSRLAALVRTTANVSLILDCCHAAGILEDSSHLDEDALGRVVAAQCARIDRFETLTDPAVDQVVQLLAAAAPQNALEDQRAACGLFSSALAGVLEDCVGLDVGWHEVLDEVRLRMRLIHQDQAPALGGRHRRRVPFTEHDSTWTYLDFACAPSGPGVHLEAGTLAQITSDDRFAVRPLGGPLEPTALLLRVTELSPNHAVLSLEDPAAALPGTPLRAVRITSRHTRSSSRWQQLRDAIAAVHYLPADAHDIRWGRVEHDGLVMTPFPDKGARLRPDDDVWITLVARRNRHAYQMYFAVFHLGPDDRLIDLLPAYPQGVALACDQDFLLASRLAHGLSHTDTLRWAKNQPAGEHSLVILVSDRPIRTDAIASSPLESSHDPLAPADAGYALVRLHFVVEELVPA